MKPRPRVSLIWRHCGSSRIWRILSIGIMWTRDEITVSTCAHNYPETFSISTVLRFSSSWCVRQTMQVLYPWWPQWELLMTSTAALAVSVLKSSLLLAFYSEYYRNVHSLQASIILALSYCLLHVTSLSYYSLYFCLASVSGVWFSLDHSDIVSFVEQQIKDIPANVERSLLCFGFPCLKSGSYYFPGNQN